MIDAGARLAEGPRWDAAGGRLLWVDIDGCALHIWDGRRDETILLDARIGACAPTDDADVLLALADRLQLLSGEVLAPTPWPAGVRANDGGCDPQGRFWIGSTALDQRPGAAALYRLEEGELVEKVPDLAIANGIGWSPDGSRVYYVDTPTKRVDVFAYRDGELHDRAPLVRIERGSPDGLCVDDEGCVWVALFGGGAVQRFTADGRLDRTVEVPAGDVTAPCFYEGSLVVTGGGRVWIEDVGVGGPPARQFRR